MTDDGEPGEDEHPTGGYAVGMFNEVSSVNDFAAVIGVPKKAMELVVPLDINCKSKGCPFKANQRAVPSKQVMATEIDALHTAQDLVSTVR
jgi:hypothetical protein